MSGNAPWSAVPADLGPAMRPELAGLADAIIAAIRAEVPDYGRPLEGEFGRQIRAGVSIALEQFTGLLGSDRDLPDLRVYEVLGANEHRDGRTLDALQNAYRVGARVAWQHVSAFGERAGWEPRTLYRFAEAIFVYIDRLAAASVAGWAQEQSLQAGTLQARRHALIELLVRDPAPAPTALEHAAQQAGWTLPRSVAAVALGEPEADPVALARRAPSGAIAAALEPVGLLVVPDPDGPGRPAQLQHALRRHRAVLGPTVPLSEAHVSAARALAAWPLHARGLLGDDVLARADEHLLALLVRADARLARDLVRRRLAPLDAMTDGARARALQTVRAWLDAHGDVPQAAAALHVHPQTVRYRVARLREAFGDALDDPAARLELSLALVASGLLGNE